MVSFINNIALFVTMDFILAYLFFGPIVAIPLGLGILSWGEMLVQGIGSQIAALLIVHGTLQLAGYQKQHKRAIVEKFALLTKREVRVVRRNTEELTSKFYAHFGHFGYYLSLIFFSFALGVAWATVVAFALRLKTLLSAVFIIIGSVLAFLFWYVVIMQSLNYIAADAAFVVAVGLSFLLLFYGQLRERDVLKGLKRRIRKR